MYVLIGILQVKIAYVMRNVSGQLCYFKGPDSGRHLYLQDCLFIGYLFK